MTHSALTGSIPTEQAEGPVVGWQPIETAPVDGTPFVALALSRTGAMYDSKTFKPFGCWWSEGGEFSEPGWAREVHGFRSFGNYVAHPTHWMPLPAAPTPTQAQDGYGAARSEAECKMSNPND